MPKEYKAESMIKNSRHINYYNTLNKSIQNDVLKRIDELVVEEQEYCDKGNYVHLCDMLSCVSIYEVIPKYGKSEDEVYNIVAEEMFKFVQPRKVEFQKSSKKSWFWTVIKKIVPIGFKKGSGTGWRYTWHNDTSKAVEEINNTCKTLKSRAFLL